MRLFFLSLCVVLAAGCGGTWSNKDLEFVNALPTRAELKAKLPETASSTQPLEGPATRRDGLSAGDPSKAYADAKAAVTNFNGLLDSILTIVDTVRAYPPTSRTATSRTWGPWPDQEHPGVEFQVVITRATAEATFGWAVRVRRKGGAFVEFVTGTYVATDTVKRGHGDFAVHVKDLRDTLQATPDLEQLDEIAVWYTKDAFPQHVDMKFTFRPLSVSGLSEVGFVYDEWADQSGRLYFRVRAQLNPVTTATDFTADWLPSGAGRATGQVIEGSAAGAKAEECWDTNFKVTYFSESWSGVSSGRELDCVAIAH